MLERLIFVHSTPELELRAEIVDEDSPTNCCLPAEIDMFALYLDVMLL